MEGGGREDKDLRDRGRERAALLLQPLICTEAIEGKEAYSQN